MRCSSCKSILKSIEYQARSADEAQRQIFRCVNCPLNIDDFSKQRSDVHIHLKRSRRQLNSTPRIDSSKSELKQYVCACTRSSEMPRVNGNPSNSIPIYVSNYIDQAGRIFRYHHGGTWSGLAVNLSSTIEICPNITLITIKTIHLQQDHESKYLHSHTLNLNGDNYVLDGDHTALWMEVFDTIEVKHTVEKMYILGFAPSSLSRCFTESKIGSLSNISARAYDKSSVTDYDHMFSTKPDGERLWMTRIGIVWLYSKMRAGHIIVGWSVDEYDDTINSDCKGPILDIESFVGFRPILIDILMDSDGNVMKNQRSLADITIEFEYLNARLQRINEVEVRQFFDTLQEALEYKKSVPYPTDGIVALSRSGTDMFKIKSEKSIELALQSDGSLETSDGHRLFSSDLNKTYSESTIIELKFVMHNGDIQINHSFHRSDKTKANDMMAVSSIIQSSFSPKDDSSNIIRTEIWRWSNTLRDSLYQIAQRNIQGRSVILDIGTGSGQSVDSFESMKNCSFILVEPDKDKCKKLIRRLNIRHFDEDPRSIIPVISQLRRGTLKYHVVNCMLEQIVHDKAVMQNLIGVVSHCIACFSAQFVIQDLSELSGKGINVVGCCYMYNGIGIHSAIIDQYGLSMKRVNEHYAVVKWGTDEAYKEPCITNNDIPQSLVSIGALNLIHNSSSSYKDIVNNVCSHVWILRSR